MSVSINPEAAAFTYLMAKTEAICQHEQGLWFRHGTSCGSAACLAGHAAIYECGGKDELEDYLCRTKVAIRHIAYDALFDEYEEKGEAHEALLNIFKIVFEWDATGYFSSDGIPDSGEKAAIEAFRQWVEHYGDPETVDEFQRLITLDLDALKEQTISVT